MLGRQQMDVRVRWWMRRGPAERQRGKKITGKKEKEIDRIEKERWQGRELKRQLGKEWVVSTESHKRDCEVKRSEWAPPVQGHLTGFSFFFPGRTACQVPRATRSPDPSWHESAFQRWTASARLQLEGREIVPAAHGPPSPSIMWPLLVPSRAVFPSLSKNKRRQLLHFVTLPLGGTRRTSAAQQTFFHMSLPVKAVLK